MKIRVGVERFDPSKDHEPHIEWYELEVDERSTLLDVLLAIERRDPTIAVPYSCRRGVCGSCTVLVNEVAVPACSTTMGKIIDCLGSVLVIKPLRVLPRVRDLVVDRSRVLDVLNRYRYWLHRVEPYIPPERMSMELAHKIQEYRKCSLCLACLGTCPLTLLDKSFGSAVAFRMIYERLIDNRDGFDRVGMALNEGLYKCLVCDACSAVCPHEIELGEAVIKLREECWRRGLAPLKVRDAVESVLDPEYGNPLWLPREERGAWLEGFKPSERAKVLIFAGCMASYVDRDSVKALAAIMEHLGIEYVALADKEYCCGMPLYLAGAIEEAKDVARKNIELFRELGIETIVTPCPSCYRMIKTIYPKLGVEIGGIKVVHVVELLYNLIKEGKVNVETLERMDVVATYHDPCDLGRHEGIYEEPRYVIKHLVQEFVEMKRRKDYAQCCGAGGNLRICNPELSIEVAKKRLELDLPRNANLLLHACPTCKIQLMEASEKLGLSIRHMSIQELFAKCMGISY